MRKYSCNRSSLRGTKRRMNNLAVVRLNRTTITTSIFFHPTTNKKKTKEYIQCL